MTTTASSRPLTTDDGPALSARLVSWLEDGAHRDDLFADDLFSDLTVPLWRLQGTSAADVYRIREASHPFPGRVRVERLEPTDTGFLLQFEERWHTDGQDWYSRELLHAVVAEDRVTELRIYCTGDWDEEQQRRHAEDVKLARP